MIEDIKKTLWAAADKLRANTDATEYKHLVLGLIFVKYISDTFAARPAELEDRDYYKEVNVFCVPETARGEASAQPDIGKRTHFDRLGAQMLFMVTTALVSYAAQQLSGEVMV